VSLRRIDTRFVLPHPVRSTAVLGGLAGWSDGLAGAGVEVVPQPRPGLDLVVAPRRLAREALRLRPRAVVVEGGATRLARNEGYATRALLPRPQSAEPALLLPLDERLPVRYAISAWSVVDANWKAARRAVAARLASIGALPPVPCITVATETAGAPFLIAAAGEFGIPADAGWVLTLGQGDVLSRNVFHLFPRAAGVPRWVLKFSRAPGNAEPFERDERGLRAAARAGGAVAARAPRLLGRFRVGGIEASLETAAIGRRLRELLLEPGRAREKEALVNAVAAWTIDVARETCRPAESLERERRRLMEEVLRAYPELGADPSLVQAVSQVPGCLQHNDLGSWNVVVHDGQFVAVDWESASECGLVLWDLVYFLADALAVLDGAVDGATRHRHTTRLFAGELPRSQVLFGWLRRACSELRIPADAVGAVVGLCWMHHALSPGVRSLALAAAGGDGGASRLHGTELNAREWFSHPALGQSWPAWQRERRSSGRRG